MNYFFSLKRITRIIFFFLILTASIQFILAQGPYNEIYKSTGLNENNAWHKSEKLMPPAGFPLSDSSTTPSEEITQSWNFTAGGAFESSPLLYSPGTGGLYIGNDDGNVYYISVGGSMVWNYATGGPVKTSPLMSSNFIYVGSDDGKVYSLNYSDGKLIWDFQTGGAVRSSALTYSNFLFIGSDDGKLYSIRYHNGSNYVNGTLNWSFQTGGPVRSSPTVINYNIFIGSDDGKVYSIGYFNGTHYVNGTLNWSFQTGGPVRSSPLFNANKIYIGSDDGKVYALDFLTGQEIWNFTTGGPVRSSVKIFQDKLYIGSDDGKVYALDSSTGQKIWSYQTGGAIRASALISKSTVFIGSDDGNLYGLNPFNGVLKWKYPIGGSIQTTPVEEKILNQNYTSVYIYFGSSNNKTYKLLLPFWTDYNLDDYNRIAFSDGNFSPYSDSSDTYDSSYHRFKINQNPKDVSQLDIYFKGYSDNSDTKIYFFNFESNRWDYINKTLKDKNESFLKTSLRRNDITDPIFHDYINQTPQGNYLWVIAQANSGGVGGSCPFVFSFDGKKYWFDHEGFPFATMSITEKSSYGRLEHLRPVDGG